MVIVDDLKKRLGHFGVKSPDDLALLFALDKAENYIKNNCNRKEIPEALKEVFIDLACGYYLKAARLSGQAVSDIVDNQDQVVKAISEGDTKIDFAVGTSPESMFDSLVEWLINSGQRSSNFARFRRLVW